MIMMGCVMCFCGPDGSGKTTLARALAVYLRSRRRRLRISWLRGTHTLSSLVARFVGRFELFRGMCNPYYGICIPRELRCLWLWLELVSILPIVLIRMAVPRILGYIVVAERSLVDFLVWLILTLRWGGAVRSLVARIVLALSTSLCSYVIYVRAEERVLLLRRRGSAEEFLIPVELRIYDALARALDLPCVDTTSRSVYESVAEVLRIIGDGRGERCV